MQKASLVLSEQRGPWRLIIEPWMLEFGVSAEVAVRIEAEGLEELDGLEFEILAEQSIITVWAHTHTFSVRVGPDATSFDFSAVADALDGRGRDDPRGPCSPKNDNSSGETPIPPIPG